MDILELLSDETADWLRYPPAREEALDALIEQTGLSFPEEYLSLLRYSNGGDGPLDTQPCWFIIEPVEGLIELNDRPMQVYVPNIGYQVQEYLPGYFAFGTNGSGEFLVFNTQEEQPWKVYSAPMIGSDEDVMECTSDFRTFVELMGKPGTDGSCD